MSSAFILREKRSPRVIVEGIAATHVSGIPGIIEIAGCSGNV